MHTYKHIYIHICIHTYVINKSISNTTNVNNDTYNHTEGIREHLDAIPPIFDDCTAELTYEAEKEAQYGIVYYSTLQYIMLYVVDYSRL